MIRIKKQAEQKAAAAAAESEAAAEKASSSSSSSSSSGGGASADAGASMEVDGSAQPMVSLLGIGGVSKGGEKKGGAGGGRKRTPGEIRIQKDIGELDGGKAAEVIFPNPNDLTNFNVVLSPDTGCWAGAKYQFNFSIGASYPFDPPKVVCKTKIYHPNINLEGAVCLNILRADWKPVLDINAIIYGLLFIFYEPEANDPLNHEAAELLRNNKTQFEAVVKRTLQGYAHAGEAFPKLI